MQGEVRKDALREAVPQTSAGWGGGGGAGTGEQMQQRQEQTMMMGDTEAETKDSTAQDET